MFRAAANPEEGFEVAGLEHRTDFISENHDNDDGGRGGDGLECPAGQDESQGCGHFLDEPHRCDARQDPEGVGVPKQHVQAEEYVAVERDFDQVLPADASDEAPKLRHYLSIRYAETYGAQQVVAFIRNFHAPGSLVAFPEPNQVVGSPPWRIHFEADLSTAP